MAVQRIAAFLLTFFFCAASSYAETLEDSDPNQGFLLFKLVELHSGDTILWKTLKVTNKQTGAVAEVRGSSLSNDYFGDGSEGPYLFFSRFLPNGKYEITGIEGFGKKKTSYKVSSTLGTFSIESAKLTNLGLVLCALPEKEDGQIRVSVLSNEDTQADVLQAADQRIRRRVSALGKNSWDSLSIPNSEVVEFIKSA